MALVSRCLRSCTQSPARTKCHIYIHTSRGRSSAPWVLCCSVLVSCCFTSCTHGARYHIYIQTSMDRSCVRTLCLFCSVRCAGIEPTAGHHTPRKTLEGHLSNPVTAASKCLRHSVVVANRSGLCCCHRRRLPSSVALWAAAIVVD